MNTVLTSQRRLVASTMIAIGVCLTLGSCGDTKGTKRLLHLKLDPKDAFILYIRGENEILIGDSPLDLGGPFEATYRWDVLSVDPEGNIEFDVTVKSAEYSMFMRSLGPALNNAAFKVRMAADGEILGFDGTDKMRAEVSTRLTFPLIEQRKENGLSAEDYKLRIETSKRVSLAHIQDEALRGLFEPLFRVWPAIPVAPGDRWTLERMPTYLPIPEGSLFATTEFEVTSWEDGEVTLTAHADLQTLDADQANKLSGDTHGTIILDATGGFLKSASMTREVKRAIVEPSTEQEVKSTVTFYEKMVVKVLRL